MHEINLQNFTIEGLKFENKRSYIYSNSTSSAFTPPVRPGHSTGQTGALHRSDRCAWVHYVSTGQTGPNKTDRVHTLPNGEQPDKPLT